VNILLFCLIKLIDNALKHFH